MQLSQVQEESKVLRREVQLLELERSGGLSNARKREILDEAEHSRNAALAYKHLTQAKVMFIVAYKSFFFCIFLFVASAFASASGISVIFFFFSSFSPLKCEE